MSSSPAPPSARRRLLTLTLLILAGEAIFVLPFVLARIFRSTFLVVFEIDNFQLGTMYSVYGVVALAAYLLGGPIADRFDPRRLMSVSLISTALGGLVMAADPSLGQLRWLYGFWGMSTILLFWAAMIRVTRRVGGEDWQGTAFGALDGGRGLVAALLATACTALFSQALPVDSDVASQAQRAAALSTVIRAVVVFIVVIGVGVLVLLPKAPPATLVDRRFSLKGLRRVVAMPRIWLQAIIILCAYVGYKTTDDLSLYAEDVLNMSPVEGAVVSTISFWVRPLAALIVGFAADRTRTSAVIPVCFAVVLALSAVMGTDAFASGAGIAFFTSVAFLAIGVFALRGLYYAVMDENRVPVLLTGTAVGFVSFVGYLPDVFHGPLMGWLLDASPGPAGHRHVFQMLAGFSAVGLLAGGVLAWMNRGGVMPRSSG